MKILIYTDVHLSQNSSIVRSMGKGEYSKRLENVIKSVSWAEKLAVEKGCEAICCLGDFFDKANLNSEELSAVSRISWSHLHHWFLVGNHEISSRNLSHSSTHLLDLGSNFSIISNPSYVEIGNAKLLFLPYVFEDERKPLNDYFKITDKNSNIIYFSHNDIAGIQMGQYLSESGFSVEEIDNCCDLFVNGHLHNGQKISDKLINIGNLTGQNFSEDATRYTHNVMVLDTETLSYELIENPNAFNFYKLDFTEKSDIDTINNVKLKNNAVVTVRVNSDDSGLECIKTRFLPHYSYSGFPKNCQVTEGRLILVPKIGNTELSVESNFNKINHLQKFKEYIITNLGDSQVVLDELMEVCKND